MLKNIKIPNYKKMSNIKKLEIYDKPKFVYIPLASQNDTNITVVVKKGDYVKKGTIVGKRKGNLRIPILSSVSGSVVDFVEMPYLNGSIVKCVKIENDFKETPFEEVEVKKHINQYTKDEFINILKKCGIVGLSGVGFPTYVKYEDELSTLVVNALECEPYLTADDAIAKKHMEEILETIDAILEINHMEEAYIAVKKINLSLLKIINNYIGTYLKIHLVTLPDTYSIGWERELIHEIKHMTYQDDSMEKGIVVNNISTIYAMYEALKYQKPLTERIVTFTGEMLKSPCNVLVKIGTPVNEVIEYLGGYRNIKKLRFVAGGPMMGITLPNDHLVVSANLNCVLVLKEEKEVIPNECLRCGKCVQVCPAKLSPVLIKEGLYQKTNWNNFKPERCIECGLCTYVCPARIDVRSYVRKAKKRSREE